MTWHLYAYCANNPVNYENPSGHVLANVIGAAFGAGIVYLVGNKIAKKTNAKGWKKVAIIAGCAVAGGVVGAIAGPKVADVTKKAASVANRVLTQRSATYRSMKMTLSNAKSSAGKVVSKAKQVISKGKTNNSVIESQVSTTKNSKIKEILDVADNYNLSDETFNEHILKRDGPNSLYKNKSHFDSGFDSGFDVKYGINSTLRGNNFIMRPNTNNRSGYIFEQTFIKGIGTNSKGKVLYTMKVVIDEIGNVVTAFPIK